MKIQNSRNSKQNDKDYSAVCHQQGRMITDFDLNEQALISRDRLNRALKDVIGSGTPRCNALLQVDDDIPSLHWGTIYVDGIPAEARSNFKPTEPIEPPDSKKQLLFNYDQQLYFPQAPELPKTPYKLYADVWDRTVIWLEDDKLRDPGLYGADTTTRTQTMAQIKCCDPKTDPMCFVGIGTARLHLTLRSLSSNSDPCDPCAEELELNEPVGNYHFRAEIHDVHYDNNDQPDKMVLKWSSENAAEAYKSTDTPPDFASNQFVYEYFDEISEKQLGKHPAHDNANESTIDGKRTEIQNELSDTPPKDYVRRWNGWCKIEKTANSWKITEGFEGPFDLTSGINSGPGTVSDGGETVTIELEVITLKITLADNDLLAGDYWNAVVREAIHQQGDILLKDKDSNLGASPEGELHHYMLLVNVDEDGNMSLPAGSDCDKYKACQPPQFPSLTDLRADDICYDNSHCELSGATTVQGALEQLCKKNDLPWHNKHLHGWGIVCGLALSCDKDTNTVNLSSGYALDCEGRDLYISDDININVIDALEKLNIVPARLDANQGICLYLDHGQNNKVEVKFERYDDEEKNWQDRLKDKLNDSLLLEFYNECIIELIDSVKAELKSSQIEAQCALSSCGKKHIPPAQRRSLALANIAFHRNNDQTNTVLNVSPCEHLLLKDLYDNLLKILSSKTFCGQLNNGQFPQYPFADSCRATWFTPSKLDHVRIHPNGNLLFGWQRNNPNIYVFKQTKDKCTGDLAGILKVPEIKNNSISDFIIDSKNNIHVSAVQNNKNTIIAATKLAGINSNLKDCYIEQDWKILTINDAKIVKLEISPWSSKKLFAVALCKGVFLFDTTTLFETTKHTVNWVFSASGHIAFDSKTDQVFASNFLQSDNQTESLVAATFKKTKISNRLETNSCDNGYYNSLVSFNGNNSRSQRIITALLIVNQRGVEGNDGFVISPSTNRPAPASSDLTSIPANNNTTKARANNNFSLYLVINEDSNKQLCRFDAGNTEPINDNFIQWFGDRYHPLGENDQIALKYLKKGKFNGVIASRYNQNDIQYIPGNRKLYDTDLLSSIPVQAGPVDILNSDKSQNIYVLNYTGQSITVLDYQLQVYQQQRGTLQKYRDDVLDAYSQLLSRVLQYLKDCFCHKLLVDCPECEEGDKVYLGCLSIKDSQVHNICNFTKRKYVKTFPTMSYWLSMIPIGPIVAWAIEEICCLIIPDFNNQQQTGSLKINNQQLNLGRAALNIDQSQLFDQLKIDGQDLFKETVAGLVNSGQKDKISLQQIESARYSYKPGVIAVPIKKKLTSNVSLLEQASIKNSNQVLILEKEISDLKQQNTSILRQFEQVNTDKTLAEKNINKLTEQIDGLKQNKDLSEQRMQELQTQLTSFNKFRAEVQPLLLRVKSVKDLKGISKANQALLAKNNIVTVQQLADISATKLQQFGISLRTSAKIIEIAKTSLKL